MPTTIGGSYPAVNSDSDATINGVTVGKGGGAVSTNTAVGYQAINANSTGQGGTALGYTALKASTGNFNTGLGYEALLNNTSGANNTAVGVDSLYSNTTASNNCALGASAMLYNTTGASNVAIGNSALQANTTASNNTAVGYQALYANTTGTSNTSVGYQSLDSCTTGTGNTALGFGTGVALTTGGNNTFIGRESGEAVTTANNNTFVGGYAGEQTTGSENTFVGGDAGYLITTGSKNTILGRYNGNQGGYDFRTASNHIVLSDGDGTLRMYMNGSGNVFWNGMRANAGTYTIRLTPGAEMVFDVSSAKYKNNIRNSVYGLDAVMQLKSRQFEYKDDGRSDVGLIAEEVYEVIPELAVKNKDGEVDAVSYDRFVSVCIKAIQELNAKVEAQALEIAQLKGN
jgi:hypothetical protein